ncbi:hypothetical protein SAMN04488523_1262 [Sulfitobacter brevis]|uniref:Uncharacterized protein n=1 Tax=Sulfitobacter brevis TaxID=74348 RepID=A0A1I2GKQ5_9RHOB|nr:hypothetical protein SAMN04488523_1262 [Sulfitobacter brevis]
MAQVITANVEDVDLHTHPLLEPLESGDRLAQGIAGKNERAEPFGTSSLRRGISRLTTPPPQQKGSAQCLGPQ